jgi:aminoglycoside phosphotransferase (APT) family kinase protein
MKQENIMAVRSAKTIYREDSLSVKLFDESYSASDVLNEALNLSIVHEIGFSVPRLEEVKKIDGKWAILAEFIEGSTLADLIVENPGRAEEYIERMVDIQIEMHSYTADRLRHHTDKMRDKIAKSGLDATNRYELQTRLASLPRHSKLCHGDVNPGNVIITPEDKAYVIDWAHATQGNASADAARTYLLFRIAGEDQRAEQYLGLFCKKSDTARQYVQRWMPIVAASQLVKGKPEELDFLRNWTSVVEYE